MKKRIDEIFRACLKEQSSLKIPYSKNIKEIKINEKAKSRFGSCKIIKGTGVGSCYIIELSSELIKAGDNEIKNVLHHEIIHTCRGCMNHGEKWKKYAERLNKAYGYNIKRTTSYESLGIEKPEKKEDVRYMIECEKCGMVIKRYRRCKLINEIEKYRCGKCGGKLNLK